MSAFDDDPAPGLAPYRQALVRELRVRIVEKNLRQKQIAAALEEAGIPETAKGLSAKLREGRFSAAFYLAVKEVIKAF